jgi:hypothetical protein
VEHRVLTGDRPRNVLRFPKVAEQDFDVPPAASPSQFFRAPVADIERDPSWR